MLYLLSIITVLSVPYLLDVLLSTPSRRDCTLQ